MTSTLALDRHPLLACLDVVESALVDVAGVQPGFMSVEEKREALLRLTTLTSELEALRLRVVVASDDVAEQAACRTVADWLAPRTRTDRNACARAERLARAVDERWTLVAAAIGDGRVSVAQAEVIVAALDDLPSEVERDTAVRAETRLIADAAHFAPAALRRLGTKILEVVAPHAYDDQERRVLERALRRAEATTRLRFRRRGDGATDLDARVPDALAGRLRSYLEAFTAPRQAHTGCAPVADRVDPATGARLSQERLMGEAFCALIERLDPNQLPEHGGTATTVVVTIDLDQLVAGLGVAETDGGQPITAGEARRLACNAALIPAVLGRQSEVLDLGRTSRLFSPAQRKALAIRHPECRAEECTVPAAWCEAHHLGTPWSTGGRTDLADGTLLCHFHHRRIHDARFRADRLPHGDIRYHRRP
ncbi:MAG: DUF222 domain-containing protein [Nocardioides sp.]